MKKTMILLMGLLLGLSWYITLDSWLGNQGKYEEAISQAKLSVGRKLYMEAVEKYEEAMTYVGENAQDSLEIARLYQQMGDMEGYRTQLTKIIESFGPESEAVTRLYQHYQDNGREQKAIDLVVSLMSKYPENSTVDGLFNALKGEYYELYNTYPLISQFYGEYAIYESEGKKGLIDTDGEVFLPAIYDAIDLPIKSDDMISVQEGTEKFYVNGSGYRVAVAEEEYQSLGILSDRCIVAKKNGKYGYLDKNLKAKTEFIWDDATIIKDNIGAVKQGDKWAIINRKMELLTEYIYEDVKTNAINSCSDNEKIWVKEKDGYKLIDVEGNEIIKGPYADVNMFADAQLCPVSNGSKWGYADNTGKLVIDYQYDDAKSFSQGFAPVKQNGLWGYIDEKGNMPIEVYFQEAFAFNQGKTAPVKIGQEWVLIKLKIYS